MSAPLKCPSCGSSLQAIPDASTATCAYCQTVVSLADGVARVRVEHTGAVSVDGIATLSNLLLRAEQGMSARDYPLSFKYFTLALDADATSFEAWHGCLRAATQDFTDIDLSWVPLLGIHGLGSIARNALVRCPSTSLVNLKSEIASASELLEEVYRDLYNRELRANIMRGVRIGFPVVLVIFILISVTTFLAGNRNALWVCFLCVVALGIWVNNFNPRKLRKKRPKPGQTYIESKIIDSVVVEINQQLGNI